jgi:hypothetical protein
MNKMCQEFAIEMQNEFEMSMLGEFSIFIGLHISQFEKGILISQTKYIKEMLKKFIIEDCATVNTPMVTSYKLSDVNQSLEANQTLYMSMIDNLLYVTTSSLSNIMKVVGFIA